MDAPRTRIVRRPVHGVLLLDKPLGLSSNQALQKVKWLLRAQKGGHTGTLDPLATGVLPLVFGAATKFAALHLEAVKEYAATLQLGVRTDTGDREGAVIARAEVSVYDRERLRSVALRFMGTIQQVPPMYSALKKDGKPLYDYAREGVEVERAARSVTITALTLAYPEGAEGGSELLLRVRCSKGTYVRSLAEDIGAALGCGAHLSALRRVATAQFTLAQCISLPEFEALDEATRMRCLLPPRILLGDVEEIVLPEMESGRFLSGLRRRGAWRDAEQVAVFGTNPRAFLGAASVKAGELIPRRLLSPLEIREMLGS